LSDVGNGFGNSPGNVRRKNLIGVKYVQERCPFLISPPFETPSYSSLGRGRV